MINIHNKKRNYSQYTFGHECVANKRRHTKKTTTYPTQCTNSYSLAPVQKTSFHRGGHAHINTQVYPSTQLNYTRQVHTPTPAPFQYYDQEPESFSPQVTIKIQINSKRRKLRRTSNYRQSVTRTNNRNTQKTVPAVTSPPPTYPAPKPPLNTQNQHPTPSAPPLPTTTTTTHIRPLPSAPPLNTQNQHPIPSAPPLTTSTNTRSNAPILKVTNCKATKLKHPYIKKKGIGNKLLSFLKKQSLLRHFKKRTRNGRLRNKIPRNIKPTRARACLGEETTTSSLSQRKQKRLHELERLPFEQIKLFHSRLNELDPNYTATLHQITPNKWPELPKDSKLITTHHGTGIESAVNIILNGPKTGHRNIYGQGFYSSKQLTDELFLNYAIDGNLGSGSALIHFVVVGDTRKIDKSSISQQTKADYQITNENNILIPYAITVLTKNEVEKESAETLLENLNTEKKEFNSHFPIALIKKLQAQTHKDELTKSLISLWAKHKNDIGNFLKETLNLLLNETVNTEKRNLLHSTICKALDNLTLTEKEKNDFSNYKRTYFLYTTYTNEQVSEI